MCACRHLGKKTIDLCNENCAWAERGATRGQRFSSLLDTLRPTYNVLLMYMPEKKTLKYIICIFLRIFSLSRKEKSLRQRRQRRKYIMLLILKTKLGEVKTCQTNAIHTAYCWTALCGRSDYTYVMTIHERESQKWLSFPRRDSR